ncbi:MAG: hypothetical protein ACLPYY_13915 [Acidimicrobiales bacterium]
MERVQAKPTFERQSDDVIFSLGEHGSAPISVGGEDAVLEFHYEVTIEHWVRDDRSRQSRVRWFFWDWVGVGEPPLRLERATADEVTTVRGAESVPIGHNLPYRRLVKVVRRDAPRTGPANGPASSEVRQADGRPVEARMPTPP